MCAFCIYVNVACVGARRSLKCAQPSVDDDDALTLKIYVPCAFSSRKCSISVSYYCGDCLCVELVENTKHKSSHSIPIRRTYTHSNTTTSAPRSNKAHRDGKWRRNSEQIDIRQSTIYSLSGLPSLVRWVL